jgi:hypothetical protein
MRGMSCSHELPKSPHPAVPARPRRAGVPPAPRGRRGADPGLYATQRKNRARNRQRASRNRASVLKDRVPRELARRLAWFGPARRRTLAHRGSTQAVVVGVVDPEVVVLGVAAAVVVLVKSAGVLMTTGGCSV